MRAQIAELDDGEAAFAVAVHAGPGPTVLLAAGRGGDPERHGGLKAALAEMGCHVLAPQLSFIASPVPDADALNRRVHRLHRTLAELASPGRPVLGIGHSIGATALLILAGGRARVLDGTEVVAERPATFAHLLLLAPATDFFRAPDALAEVGAPATVWLGGADAVTPPARSRFLGETLRQGAALLVEADAGHFTFMDAPPPQSEEPHPDRAAFLATIRDTACQLARGL